MKAKLAILCFCVWIIVPVFAQGTAFTYQGRVTDNGTNFNGAGQFKFALVTSTNTSSQATAAASLGGAGPYYVNGYTVTSGGGGYLTAPAVTVSGGGGSGAMAVAVINGSGVVTAVNPNTVGSGYTSTPTVTIDPPPANITYTTYWSNDGTSSAGSEPAAAVDAAVNNGLFTVVLGDTTLANMAAIDASLFARPDLQLRIWFSDGVNGFAALSPVQNLTPAPYSVMANSAGNLLGTLPAAQLSGTIPLTQLPNSLLTNNATGVSLTGAFSGEGNGLTNVPGTFPWQTASGTAQQATANTAYVATNADQVTITLPTSPAIGDAIRVYGSGTGGWSIAQNSGQTVLADNLVLGSMWFPQGTNRYWISLASSSDGSKLVAAAWDTANYYGVEEILPGSIYTSTDSGMSWTERLSLSSGIWHAVASSADGVRLVAVADTSPIYTSTNSGASWSACAFSTNWQAVASSADGVKLVAAVNGGQIYTSTNSGASWTAHAVGTNQYPYWYGVASSADGSKLVAAMWQGPIYTSSDSGTNWTAHSIMTNWQAVASSADGTKLVAAVWGGPIYTSSDSGWSWTPRESNRAWSSVASSLDGSKLVATVQDGQVYTSSDSGSNWLAREINRNWTSVASSSDGAKLSASVADGPIYTSTALGSVGALSGGQGSELELQYVGNGQFRVVSASGGLVANGQSAAYKLSGDASGLTEAIPADNSVTAEKLAPDPLSLEKISNGRVSTRYDWFNVSGPASINGWLAVFGVANIYGTLTASNFVGNGGGLTNLNAAQLSGAVPLAQLPGAVLTNNESGAVTFNGTLTLPNPSTIYSGGYSLLRSDTKYNFFAGFWAGNFTTSGSYNTAIGNSALQANTTGERNTAYGAFALLLNTNGTYNTAVGDDALVGNKSGSYNAAYGQGAIASDATGTNNIGLGYCAGANLTAGSSNIYIGSRGPSSASSEDNTIRIGSSQTQTFIAGAINGNGSGITNLNATQVSSGTVPDARLSSNVALLNASENFTGVIGIGTNTPQARLHVNSSASTVSVFDSSSTGGSWLSLGNTSVGGQRWSFISTASGNGEGAGQFSIFNGVSAKMIIKTNGTVGIGTITPDANYKLDVNGNIKCVTLAQTSDRGAKENFLEINPRAVLDKVAALPISEWNYKQDTASRHIGPMAQDFYAAFGIGPDDKHITTVDENGVALAAIQGLNEKLQQKETEITELKARLEKLEQLVNAKNGGGQ